MSLSALITLLNQELDDSTLNDFRVISTDGPAGVHERVRLPVGCRLRERGCPRDDGRGRWDRGFNAGGVHL